MYLLLINIATNNDYCTRCAALLNLYTTLYCFPILRLFTRFNCAKINWKLVHTNCFANVAYWKHTMSDKGPIGCCLNAKDLASSATRISIMRKHKNFTDMIIDAILSIICDLFWNLGNDMLRQFLGRILNEQSALECNPFSRSTYNKSVHNCLRASSSLLNNIEYGSKNDHDDKLM